MTIIKIQNNSAEAFYFGGAIINRGVNDINKEDWDKFLEDAKSCNANALERCFQSGYLKVLSENPLPTSLNDLSLDEAKKAIGACKDNQILKRWYLDLQPNNFKPRLLIVEHAMNKNLPLRFGNGELKTHHYLDQFKSLSDPDQETIDRKNDESRQSFRNEIARQEKHYKLQQEYLQKMKEII